jgi:signal transduction histidine kinase
MVLVITVAASFIAERYQVALGRSTSTASATASQAGNVLALLLGAQSSVGDYARTGDTKSLAWYHQAQSQLPAHLAILARSTSSGRDLRVLAQTRLDNLTGIVKAVASHAPPSDIDDGLTHVVAPMDQLRGDLVMLQVSEMSTIASNRSEVDTIESVVQGVEIAGLLVGVIGGVTAMVLFVRFVVRRIGEVGANARRLGVSESLLPVTSAADEIGELADELRATSTLLTQRSTDLVRAHTAAVEAADQADQLLSRVSHELRTPLTAVLGFGHLIERSRLSEEDSEAVEQILHGGGHMLRILEEGRAPSYTSRSIQLDLAPVVVAPLVREVLALLSPLSAGRHLDVAGCDESPVAVLADYHRFKQVLINLLSNAVKYNQAGGSIRVTCQPAAAGLVRVAVIDTGEGIAADLIDRVFVPFDRLGAEERGVEGTGIGLSLSKTFVEAMDGTIGVNSAAGRGSTFWVELPAAGDGLDRVVPATP